MAKTVGVDGIAAACASIFRQYGQEVDERLRSDLQYAGEFATNEVHRLSPSASGKYAGGWDYTFKARKGELTVVVGNTSKPSLTHLLEKGHMNRDGSWNSAREHIEPAFEAAAEVIERRLDV